MQRGICSSTCHCFLVPSLLSSRSCRAVHSGAWSRVICFLDAAMHPVMLSKFLCSMVVAGSDVKVYTVNGAVAGSSSSIPDWLTRKRAAKAKGKRALKEREEGQIELIQGFEFPEASVKVKTTRDGHHAIATGTYKPQMRVWDLDELTMKFERHTDAENVDFIVSGSVFPATGSIVSPSSVN